MEITAAALATVGETVFVGGAPAIVTAVHVYAPGQHPEGAVCRPDYVARRCETPYGDRWTGHAPGGRYRGVEIIGRYPDGVSFES